MKYMLLLFDEEEEWEPTPEVLEPWARFSEEAGKLGARELGGEALQPSRTATVVSVRDGKTVKTYGPFIETKEHLGGFYIFECESLDIALKLAEIVPTSTTGHVEVRPVVELDQDA